MKRVLKQAEDAARRSAAHADAAFREALLATGLVDLDDWPRSDCWGLYEALVHRGERKLAGALERYLDGRADAPRRGEAPPA